ncbi:MAG: tetratricopeptide repeat protein [Bacteroidetes bacterium]|nr:tetratricopeptide repeat protein [Bacteroidota bacterium]
MRIDKTKKNQPTEKAVKRSSESTFVKRGGHQLNKWLIIGIALGIGMFTLIAYYPCLDNGFTNWDDPTYIIENPIIKELSAANIKRIFSEVYFANYQPLQIVSYAIEYHFFGLNASGYHAVSLAMHIVITLLVGFFIYLLINDIWLSAAAALIFGVHSIHVESVAWAAERKDLLYALFLFSALIFYTKYVQSAFKLKWIVLAFLFFILSVFSKTMAVSLVPMLILIDILYKREFNARAIIEKIPFVVLAIIMGLISVNVTKDTTDPYAQESAPYPLMSRIYFASHNLLNYLVKSIVPINQKTYYQYPVVGNEAVPIEYMIAFAVVLILSGLIIYSLKFTRWIFFGVGFFTVAVALVLMLYTIGPTIFSERYTYVASAGLYALIAYGLMQLGTSGIAGFKLNKNISLGIICVCALLLIVKTRAQCEVWKDSITFWSDVIKQDSKVPIAYNNRGNEYKSKNDFEKAIPDLKEAIRLKKDYLEPYIILGDIYRTQGKSQEAMENLNYALKLKPNSPQALVNRGIVYCVLGNIEEGKKDFDKAIEYKKEMFEAYGNRGNYYAIKRDYPTAIQNYEQAIRINPDFQDAYLNLGKTYFELKQPEKSLNYLRQYLNRNGPNPEVYWMMALVYASQNDFANASAKAAEAKSKGFAVNDAQIAQWGQMKQ